MKSIYVSKLDECTTESMLASHFSKYGFINEIQLSKLPTGKCKGYAKITTKDVSAFRIILNSEHVINNVKIRVEPFIEGEAEILEKDREMVQRRVCVFGVPKNFNDHTFRKVFDEVFGDVENAYVRRNGNKKFNYGFVTFNTKEMAQKALKVERVPIQSSQARFMQIKEFRSKGLKRRQKKMEETKQKQLCFNKNFVNVFGEQLISTMFNFTNQNQADYNNQCYGYQSGQFQQGSGHQNRFLKRLERYSINSGKKTVSNAFMNPEALKKYIGRILQSNSHINDISHNQIEMLELFYFNNIERGKKNRKVLNYDSIARRFSKVVDWNHHSDNLVLKPKTRNGSTGDTQGWGTGPEDRRDGYRFGSDRLGRGSRFANEHHGNWERIDDYNACNRFQRY